MTWGDQHLHPGDKIVQVGNSNLWWLIVAETDTSYMLLYASPEHRRSGIIGHVGWAQKDSAYESGFFRTERRENRA